MFYVYISIVVWIHLSEKGIPLKKQYMWIIVFTTTAFTDSDLD